MRQKEEGRKEERRKGKLANEIIVKRLGLDQLSLSFEQLLDFSEEELHNMLNDLGAK